MAYNENILELENNLSGTELRIGIVMSRFNPEIGEGLFKACIDELISCEVQESNILLTTVPGALEIPLILQKMALSDQFDALIALGAVIRGETYHFEIVSNESAHGLITVQLDTEIPIANGILTTNTTEQATNRMKQKGSEAARTALEMANLHNKFDEITS